VDGRAQHVLKTRMQAREKRLVNFKRAVITWTDRVSGGFRHFSSSSPKSDSSIWGNEILCEELMMVF